MEKILFFTLMLVCLQLNSNLASGAEEQFPVRGFCIGAPQADRVEEFVKFIKEELAPRQVNTLVVRIDYNYQFTSQPEISGKNALSTSDVKKIVAVCKEMNINLIPQINLLGHQSWASNLGNLLRTHPEFDETPRVKMPEKYVWPNADGLYCKSYCPLHPQVHDIVFQLIDEICDVFEASAFHAGMDEVFYIGDDKCPRCSGRDNAELFAGEVRVLRDHLKLNNRELWIWGDRLLDGKTTGLGIWEASFNNTHRAIEMIPKDIMICDWHYERAVPTAAYFAMKGLRVITCPWRKPEVARQQVNDMVKFRKQTPAEMKERFMGLMQTVWSDAGSFMDSYYGRKPDSEKYTADKCFRALYEEIELLSK